MGERKRGREKEMERERGAQTTTNPTINMGRQRTATLDLAKAAEWILEDNYTSTSYGFQLYNFIVGIIFLSLGLNLISGSMMLVYLCIFFVHLDMGLSSYGAAQLLIRIQFLLFLYFLVIVYLGILQNAGESMAAQGFSRSGLFLLLGKMKAESHLMNICN